MGNFLTISEVSHLLNIPESTLRYWQEKGIFSIRRENNNYRQYTLSDVVEIAEIAFNRNLGIPVRKMQNFLFLGFDDYCGLLEETSQALSEKISALQSMHRQIQKKIEQIKVIDALRAVDYVNESVPFDRVVYFSYEDRHQLIRYTQNPSLYVRVIPSDRLDGDIRGIIGEEESGSLPLLWKKEKEKPFAAFLIEENASEGYTNNIAEKLSIIQKHHKTGLILANYLLGVTADGKRIDYLKGYVELLD